MPLKTTSAITEEEDEVYQTMTGGERERERERERRARQPRNEEQYIEIIHKREIKGRNIRMLSIKKLFSKSYSMCLSVSASCAALNSHVVVLMTLKIKLGLVKGA